MPQATPYYLWVRIIDTSKPVTGTVGDSDGPMPKAPDKRPKKRSVAAVKNARPQLDFDGVEAWFGIDRQRLDLEYGRAFADEATAIDWLASTEEGKAWDAGSVNRFLITATLMA